MAFTLPPIFQSPYLGGQQPKACCCNGGGAKVTVNVGEVGTGFGPNGVETRTAQAARLIAEANKNGFVVFQGR